MTEHDSAITRETSTAKPPQKPPKQQTKRYNETNVASPLQQMKIDGVKRTRSGAHHSGDAAQEQASPTHPEI